MPEPKTSCNLQHFHSISERVRWGDVDAAGIIFYGSYVRFFEFAESEMFRVIDLPYSKLASHYQVFLPRVHVEVDFRYPARLDDLLEVRVGVADLGRTSLKLRFQVLRVGSPQEELIPVADAHYVLVCVDQTRFNKVEIPSDLRERLAPYVNSHKNI